MISRFWLFGGLGLLFFTQAAQATLGEAISTAQQNAVVLKAAQKATTTADTYTVSEMSADGSTIKQYANREGIVFAVSWSGFAKPDLGVLFGGYFNEYMQASNELPKQVGARSTTFKSSRLVVRRGTRMRDQRGFVYIPSLVPKDVNIEELREK
jgi:hypothetical protein